MGDEATVLFRPVGQAELDLIRASGWRQFPPRLPSQPIFYPVLEEEYAIQIARDWNTRDPNSGFVGYVTRFPVRTEFLKRYAVRQVGAAVHREYWVPAEELPEFNANITGLIEVIHEFRPPAEQAPGAPLAEPSPDLPTWMRVDWEQLCRDLGLAGDVAGVLDRLRGLYGQPRRVYHNLKHVGDCLLSCRSLFDSGLDKHVMQAALWFHDAIYVPGAPDNEERSAALAQECLAALGGSRELGERVAALILATDHRRPPQDATAQRVCDIDLKVLGQGIDVYDAYADAIRAEAGLPKHEYAPHRQTFLRTMLAREHIFHTVEFRQQYEAAARSNMQRELAHWTARYGR